MQAWKILEVTLEGAFPTRTSRLQLLITKFKNLKMLEDESISRFNLRVLDISDESFALGEKISQELLVKIF